MIRNKRDGLTARQRSHADDQEGRSQDGLRAIRRSAMQLLAPLVIAAVALASGAALTAQSNEARQVRQAEAQVLAERAAKARVDGVRLVTALVTQQKILDEIEQAHFRDDADHDHADHAEPAAPAQAAEAGAALAYADAARISGLVPQLPNLAVIEAAQLAKAEALTAAAEARAADAEQAIRRAGLNPGVVLARIDDRSAQGGPLEAAAGEGVDSRFTALGKSVARMSLLERGLDTIPTHLPASMEFISSGFGYRSDPFTGAGAMHAGLDFRGPVGAPIQAAADGTVTFAGVKGGYGNCIEITHANGMMTRYGHMSSFKARQGQKVAAGDTIGGIGSTGRSTGPHLHFEVRINGAAVNPRPFLEARG